MRKTKYFTAAAVGAALSLALAACGGGDSEDDQGGGSSVAFNDSAKKIVNPSEQKGGVLKLVHPADFDSTDPGDQYYGHAWLVSRLYARPLLTFRPAPGNDDVIPDLAQGLGTPNQDLTEWTFKLKPNVKYSDGTVVTSKDVKYAIARSNFTDELQLGPKYYKQLLDAGDYKGPYKDKNLDNFKGVTTPDPQTVVFHLKEPFAELNNLATLSQTAPVPQAKDTGAKYYQRPLSTGPYQIDNYTKGKGGTMSRNPNWDPSTDPNRKQLPDKIEIQAGVDPTEVDQRLMNGTAHYDIAGLGVTANARTKIVTDPNLKKNADNNRSGFNRYLGISTKVAPFDNIHCRKAVIHATDREATFRAYGSDFGGERATTLLSPEDDGYQKFDMYGGGPGNKGDIAKAKQELQACGKPNGFATNISYRTERDPEKKAAEAMKAALQRVGINLTLKNYTADTYTGENVGSPSFVKKNNLGLMVYGWGADFPSGYGFLQQIVDGRAIKPRGNSNIYELNNPEVNKLLDDSTKEPDAAKRSQIYNQIDRKVMEQAVVVPFVYDKPLFYRPPSMTNVLAYQGINNFTYLPFAGVK